MYSYTETIQVKLNSLGYKNTVTGVISKSDFSSDTRKAIALFNKDTKYNNGGYIDKTFLVNLDKAYKKKFPDKPLIDSYFEGWSKKLVYGDAKPITPNNARPDSSTVIVPEIVPNYNNETYSDSSGNEIIPLNPETEKSMDIKQLLKYGLIGVAGYLVVKSFSNSNVKRR
ncbi:MAG: hypothetical protein AB7V50_10575 [Vampirovibrionia bacterium]